MGKKQKRSKQPIPAEETKAARFVRVVKPRINKAIKSIKVIGYCAGSTYESTPEQQAEILGVLSDAVNALAAKFETKEGLQDEFDFKR